MDADKIVHVLIIVGCACFVGFEVNRGNYGYAATFALLDIAVIRY